MPGRDWGDDTDQEPVRRDRGSGTPASLVVLALAGLLLLVVAVGGGVWLMMARNTPRKVAMQEEMIVREEAEAARAAAARGMHLDPIDADEGDPVKPKPAGPVTWHDAAKPYRLGETLVTVLTVAPASRREFDIPALQIGLQVQNTSETKRVKVAGWAYNRDLMERLTGKGTKPAPGVEFTDFPGFSLKDDAGNNYRPLQRVIVDKEREATVREVVLEPGEFTMVTVGFERPGKDVKELLLELPAAGFGGDGTLRFKIPAKMIDRKEPR